MMSGCCEDCAKIENCKKDIGIIWGFCNTDFVPKKKKGEKTDGHKC